MHKAIRVSTSIVCILATLPCCHALWSWKKLCEFSIQWKIIPFFSIPLHLHLRKECVFVQEQGE